MTSIKWPDAANLALTGLGTGISGGLRTDDQSAGSAAGVSSSARVAAQYQQADSGARRLRFGGSLATALDGALRRLDEAASSFTWPTEGVPFATNSRLATFPAARSADLSVTLPDAANYLQEDKYLSRGFAAATPTSLDPGTYTMNLGFGGKTEKLTVTVSTGDTNADVLSAVASAVNASTLQVDAEVRSQTGVGILGPGVIPTGSFLALSVNRTRAADTPTLTDTSGHLAASLDLSATSTPLAPAAADTHQLTSLSVARPTVFRTSAYDPEATTTLSPGTYTVNYAAGPASGSVYSGSVDIVIAAGDTWGDVLSNMKSVFGSASPAMVSALVPAKRVWDSSTDELHAVVDGQGLTVSLNDPKPGWKLTLSGGTLSGGTANILSAMGLNVTAQPGSDGRMVIDGRDRTRTPGEYIADQGRVVLGQSGTFGETVPVSVLAPLDLLSQGLSDVVSAYNDLRGLLARNADQLRAPLGSASLAEDFRTPVTDRALPLGSLGLAETGTGKLLWLNADTFVQALTDSPQAVRTTLLGDASTTGFLPALAQKAQTALAAGADSQLLPQSAYPTRDPYLASPTPRTETEIEKASQLLDLVEGAAKIGPGLPKSGIVSLGASAGQSPLPWEGGGTLLRRKG